MHELGVLTRALERVQRTADEAGIEQVKTVTLEVGKSSSFVPAYFVKLYPAARELYTATKNSELKIEMVTGNGLFIKEIAY
ncbi:MAG: hydrogenase maturation nickel metallochaperone HypA [Oscillospiraceae bacterium]|nr:hydrogenase maturation nickel metallochaperone HypA [Oscillospiraceae bacterium]MBQ3049492.1 hydrogenase maturation nickel metallochaperone HypA [Oscillospiraceae bacterium]MBQ9938457.1 hydrogenase maturation nickel metallochaperone HypA [Oscillospiraceae bacterium]